MSYQLCSNQSWFSCKLHFHMKKISILLPNRSSSYGGRPFTVEVAHLQEITNKPYQTDMTAPSACLIKGQWSHTSKPTTQMTSHFAPYIKAKDKAASACPIPPVTKKTISIQIREWGPYSIAHSFPNSITEKKTKKNMLPLPLTSNLIFFSS